MTKQSQTPEQIAEEIIRKFVMYDYSGNLTGVGKGHLKFLINEAIEAERRQIEELREALEFYANESNYHPHGIPMTPYVDGKPSNKHPWKDRGRIAREALSAPERRDEEGNELQIHTTKHPYLDSKNDYPDCVYCHPPNKACVHDNGWRWELRDKDSRWLDGKGKKYYPTCPFCPTTQEGKEGV